MVSSLVAIGAACWVLALIAYYLRVMPMLLKSESRPTFFWGRLLPLRDLSNYRSLCARLGLRYSWYYVVMGLYLTGGGFLLAGVLIR